MAGGAFSIWVFQLSLFVPAKYKQEIIFLDCRNVPIAMEVAVEKQAPANLLTLSSPTLLWHYVTTSTAIIIMYQVGRYGNALNQFNASLIL